jgi:peptide/nickel transport system ATP-binding protein
MSAVKPILDVRDLRVEYMSPRGPVVAADNVSFHIQPGEVYGLAGESGCGKSTVALALLRVLGPPAVITNGEVWFNDTNVLALNDNELEKPPASDRQFASGRPRRRRLLLRSGRLRRDRY